MKTSFKILLLSSVIIAISAPPLARPKPVAPKAVAPKKVQPVDENNLDDLYALAGDADAAAAGPTDVCPRTEPSVSSRVAVARWIPLGPTSR